MVTINYSILTNGNWEAGSFVSTLEAAQTWSQSMKQAYGENFVYSF